MSNLSLFVPIFSLFFFHSNEHAPKIKSLMLHNFRVLFIRDFTFESSELNVAALNIYANDTCRGRLLSDFKSSCIKRWSISSDTALYFASFI